ncbi:MAG TPA: DUF302 domain-containing protein [Burkholderiales bacterium]|nr:DUF302 domain-containing protein [Burkholderiales bacterium]
MRTQWIVALAVAACAAFSGAAPAASADVVVRSTKGEFGEVKERVLHAIENRGLVLNYTARIGAMLERTGKDIGAARRIYGDAEMLEFCSARVSRDTMEADPRNIVFCPYSIAIYTLPKEKGRVYIAYRRLGASGSEQSVKSLRAVERLVADIVAEALRTR